jgi:hypothetical protein
MNNWDTRALHREACDAFTTLTSLADRGKNLLDRIAEITECLKKMDEFDEVAIRSKHDSTWQPPITSDEVKSFIRRILEGRRDGLRAEFNKIKLPNK